jgi:hypothetical protein
MNNLLKWESDWQMEFHPSKCQLLRATNKRKPSPTSYDIHGHRFEIVDSAKYLGVAIYKTIFWNTHWKHNQKGQLDQGLYSKKPATLSTKYKGCMLHNTSKTIAWVRMHSMGPIYQRQSPEIRKRTNTISPGL